MKSKNKQIFNQGFASWNNSVTASESIDWAEQLRILNDVTDLITPALTIEEITAAIYTNVNCLIDAYQFAVGIYNEKEGSIVYKGMIENDLRIPDFAVDAVANNRFASWCIRNEDTIFMNDLATEYSKYLKEKPVPLAGVDPKAALYVPLKLHEKIVGLITVRTIHKNVYQHHHLHLLKTVGNFIIRALELAELSSKPFLEKSGIQKEWRWSSEKELSAASKKIFSLLTKREKEVLLLMVTGCSNKALAGKLFVSAATVKSHTLNIYKKMDVANRTSAISKALEWGWVF